MRTLALEIMQVYGCRVSSASVLHVPGLCGGGCTLSLQMLYCIIPPPFLLYPPSSTFPFPPSLLSLSRSPSLPASPASPSLCQGSTGVRFEDVAGIDEVVNELQEVSGALLAHPRARHA